MDAVLQVVWNLEDGTPVSAKFLKSQHRLDNMRSIH